MSAPRAILVLTQLLAQGDTGVQTHFNVFGDYARSQGVAVGVLSAQDDRTWRRRAANLVTRVLRRLDRESSVLWHRGVHRYCLERLLRAELRRRRAQAVVLYAQDPLSARAALALRDEGYDFRLVAICHFNISEAWEASLAGLTREGGRLHRRLLEQERAVLPRVDALLFPTEFLRAEVLRRVPGVAAVPARVVSNLPQPVPAAGPDAPTGDILSIGTLEPRKNQGFLIEVLAQARVRGHVYSLTLAGSGPSEGAFRALAERLGVTAQVRFLGRVPHAASLLETHRVYAHAARMESQGIVLLEALRSARPVLAAAVGGIPETFTDGVEGFSWDLEDVSGAADRLIALLESEQIYAQASAAARRRYEERYRPDLLGPRWLQALFDVRDEAEPKLGAEFGSPPRCAASAAGTVNAC